MNERDPAPLRYRRSISPRRGTLCTRPRNYKPAGRQAMGRANHWDFEAALAAGGSHGYPDLSSPPSPGHGMFRPGTDG
jgi:hypothetical protein